MRASCRIVAVAILVQIAFSLSSAAQTTGSAADEWAEALHRGLNLLRLRPDRHDDALRAFQNALAVAPTADHRADALICIAIYHESACRRSDAIAAYKRVLTECPSCVQRPHVYFRLGELHRSISLLPNNATEDEKKAVAAEMTDANAMPYFEAAVQAGEPHNQYVLSSKVYLAGIYYDCGRKADATRLLNELVSLDIYGVSAPAFDGPLDELTDVSTSARVDVRREFISGMRAHARELAAAWSIPLSGAAMAPENRGAHGTAAIPPRDAKQAIDNEMAPVLEKLKSDDASVREAAVRELIGLRESVSDALRQIVVDADRGHGTDAGKDAALGLMGVLRLAQCADLVKTQKDSGWKTKDHSPVIHIGDHWLIRPLDWVAKDVQSGASVSVRPAGPRAGLAAYPTLKNALAAIASPDSDPLTINDHGHIVAYWHERVVCDGLDGILSTMAYSDDVKASAAWVLGEYRAYRVTLLRSLDIKDEKGLTAGYPGRLEVTGVEASYPAAEALAKTAPFVSRFVMNELCSDSVSQSARGRAAHVAMITEPEAAKKALAEEIALQSSPEAAPNYTGVSRCRGLETIIR